MKRLVDKAAFLKRVLSYEINELSDITKRMARDLRYTLEDAIIYKKVTAPRFILLLGRLSAVSKTEELAKILKDLEEAFETMKE